MNTWEMIGTVIFFAVALCPFWSYLCIQFNVAPDDREEQPYQDRSKERPHGWGL